jgi:hypothetical protein
MVFSFLLFKKNEKIKKESTVTLEVLLRLTPPLPVSFLFQKKNKKQTLYQAILGKITACRPSLSPLR